MKRPCDPEPDELDALRVLIVDDDPIFTMLAQACLDSAGYDTRATNDGVSALEMLDAEHFDIALIDLSMPSIDGFRLIGLIRGAQRLRDLAILVVTSRLDEAAWNEALVLGANAVETKPVDWTSLAARIPCIISDVRQQPGPKRRSA